ncbi:putative transcription factor [Scheffersomyces xylosifermentans]|uniref:putative transcription factor n=1 Tax=Scheffersomyces xylosifermentans TaxID=1304137 RepID=UPI00315D32A5
MPYDPHNPLLVTLPYSFNTVNDYPTEVMANRFQAWRSIIKDLVNYLKEYANVQEEIVRQQIRLQQAVGISASNSSGVSTSATSTAHSNSASTAKDDLLAINKFFLPIGNGSVQDLPTILTKYHQQNVGNASKTLKDINQVIIPKLEELRKDLLVKIKEIKNLQNDFKTSLGKELADTRALISQYNQAIDLSNKLEHGSPVHHSDNSGENGKFDPYLVKIKLDRQLKRQISEETYLYEAYTNLQTSGGKLESIIVLELQNYLSMFLNLLNTENSTLHDFLLPQLNNGFLSKETNFEWDAFISRNLPSSSPVTAVGNNTSNVKNGTFIDLSITQRKLSDLSVANYDSNLNVAVREGYLERRSKYLKSYSSGWYVLTCSYIHEFKTADRKKDQQPVMSLSLDTFSVSEHSKDDGKSGGAYKFILNSKSSNGLIHRTHNLVFRADTYKTMIDWYNDIKTLTSLPTPSARARHIAKTRPKATNNVTSNSSKAISRASSLYSSTTHDGKSIRSGNTATSPTRANGTRKERPLSQATSIANANRLSSTFSQRNNQSPRLTNMINSDGTIITPVDTVDDSKLHHEHDLQSTNVSRHATPKPAHDHSVLMPQAAIPIHGHQQQQQFITPPSGFQYYIPQAGQQPQQFYDPVQQQYYTITPTVPNPAPARQQPQPQYFPNSPQSSTPQQFVTVQPGSPTQPAQAYAINTANYFPQYVNPQQQPIQTGYGENLPYPQNHPSDLSDSQSQLDHSDHPIPNGVQREETEMSRQSSQFVGSTADITDEVSTLQSNMGAQPAISIEVDNDEKFEDRAEESTAEVEREQTAVTTDGHEKTEL